MPSDPASKSPTVGIEPTRPSLRGLLTTRRFAPLLVSQSLGAFNGALLVTTLIVLHSPPTATAAPWSPAAFGVLAAALAPLAVAASRAGRLTDRYDGPALARLATLLESVAMLVAALGLITQNLGAGLVALVLFSLHAALFEPVKHALLAQSLRADERVDGNALIEASSVGALAAGALTGALLAGTYTTWLAAAGLLAALAAFIGSLLIAESVTQQAEVDSVSRNGNSSPDDDRVVNLAVAAWAWCWFSGALLFSALPGYWRIAQDGTATLPAILLAMTLACGALLSGALSRERLEIGVLHFAALLIALGALASSLALSEWAPATAWRFGSPRGMVMLLGIAGSGLATGLLVVHCKLLVERHCTTTRNWRGIATATRHKALAGVAGVLLATWLTARSTGVAGIIAAIALGYAVLATLAFRREPHRSLRLLTDLLIHAFYRIDKQGLEHVPPAGPAVLVCNHVSFVDALVIMAVIRRPIRFVIDHRIYETPVANALFRRTRTIPIATAKESLEQKEAAFAEVARALRDGELIGLFPEGGITRSGEINRFRYGVGRIVEETPVPVVPMALCGLWGSFFSRRHGPAMSKPSLLRPCARIGLVAGTAVAPQDVTPEGLQEIVGRLRGDWQ